MWLLCQERNIQVPHADVAIVIRTSHSWITTSLLPLLPTSEFKYCTRPSMELFIRNIPPSARQEDVRTSISNVLHDGSFSRLSEEPINFDFHFIGRSNIAHRGIGALTLPNEQYGNEFLANTGSSPAVEF
ncbi:hypothetical protein RSOLAG1IB_02804 [Rhizoctonia solani AG-1 IB]|uniref:Uncharacterized protein n=1 Tax=Thanatephorus cucumeris (strain AG1-IB / isolate 7/3/14) TaxID=1108050 RepID=A0A0B7FME8_THACB|nr:hypothetical protein RSOLAG1IB_02804 [Rhizoctonia solani AG-1 IB]